MVPRPVMNERRHTVSFLIVVTLGLCIYLPLLTRNYDINGLAESAAVESGHSADLWNPNHMLYRPVGYLVRQGLELTGIQWSPVGLLQVLSAVFGALGLGFTYLALDKLTANRTIAIWMSLAVGVSWSYWTLSTDVYYFSLAAMLAAAALAVFVHSKSTLAMAACGLLAGLSILACQANIVLLPGFTIAFLIADPTFEVTKVLQRRTSLEKIAGLWIAAGAVVGPAVVGTGVLVYGHRTMQGLLNWGTRYSGNRLPMWGSWWPPRRFLETAGSAFKSIFAMDFGMFPFFLRHLKNGQPPAWVAPFGFFLMAGLLIAAFRKGAVQKTHGRTALWLLVLYGAYIPFVTWWESIEPRWFVVPNIFLAALTAVILSSWSNRPYFRVALAAGVVTLAGVNLALSAGPKHFKESIPSQMARCVANHMKGNDLFLATEWNWSDYLHYVHNRQVVSFIGEVSVASGNKTAAMQKISAIVRERQQQGAHVYMIDIESYPADYMTWLNEQTGLNENDLHTYKGSQAFQCVGSNFFRLD
jgi:hypothetical protein